jgi:hypothetical protein
MSYVRVPLKVWQTLNPVEFPVLTCSSSLDVWFYTANTIQRIIMLAFTVAARRGGEKGDPERCIARTYISSLAKRVSRATSVGALEEGEPSHEAISHIRLY